MTKFWQGYEGVHLSKHDIPAVVHAVATDASGPPYLAQCQAYVPNLRKEAAGGGYAEFAQYADATSCEVCVGLVYGEQPSERRT
ncbi:MAG: hypothetical protein EPO13_07555 [Actinomycetota bacterium]|nr:MAG: hypothetical protein EPO13_07555 [Actinomycetota bacterium]